MDSKPTSRPRQSPEPHQSSLFRTCGNGTAHSSSLTRHHHVSCAIIERDGKVLAAQRNTAAALPLKWEFPGGKIEPGESPEECLVRELKEELGVTVVIEAPLPPSGHNYTDFAVTLYPFTCHIVEGSVTLYEHLDIKWLDPAQMHTLDWADADLPVIRDYRALLAAACQESI